MPCQGPRSPLGNAPQIRAHQLGPAPLPRLSMDGGTAGAERAISLINLLLFLLMSWDLEQALPSQSLRLHLQPCCVPPPWQPSGGCEASRHCSKQTLCRREKLHRGKNPSPSQRLNPLPGCSAGRGNLSIWGRGEPPVEGLLSWQLLHQVPVMVRAGLWTRLSPKPSAREGN